MDFPPARTALVLDPLHKVFILQLLGFHAQTVVYLQRAHTAFWTAVYSSLNTASIVGVLVDLAFIPGLFRIGCLVNVLICLLNALTYLRLSNLLNNPVYLLSYTFLMLIHFLKPLVCL